jgi:hypothetical protein
MAGCCTRAGSSAGSSLTGKSSAKLFDTIAPRFAERPGGYTRILRLGLPARRQRRGRAARARRQRIRSESRTEGDQGRSRTEAEGRRGRKTSRGSGSAPGQELRRRRSGKQENVTRVPDQGSQRETDDSSKGGITQGSVIVGLVD